MEGLTFNSKIGYDDIKNQFEYLINKQKETIKLLCSGNYGIVSSVDSSSENSSLFPTLEGNTISFTSGSIVTKEGDFTEIPSFQINVPNIEEDTLVIYSYNLIGSKEKRVSNSGKAFSTWFEVKPVENSISFSPYSKFSVLRDNEVCIAVIKYGSENYIDVTKASYPFNRPWFSMCDIKHREQKGTGSSNVPHSIGLNDLTSSNLTIYDQLLTRGMIVSKDLSLAGIPGHLWKYEGSYTVVTYDTSDVGYKKVYLELKDGTFPNAISSVTKDGKDIPCHLIKGTRLIALDKEYKDEEIPNLRSGIEIQICITSTLLCSTEGNKLNEISFEPQSEGDTIITQGLQIDLADTNVSFADCSSFEKSFEIVVNKNGTIHKEPEILGYTMPVKDINDYEFSQEFDIPVKLQVFRVQGGWTGTLSINIEGYSDGELKQEIIEMQEGSTISELSSNYYSKITSVKCDNQASVDIVIFAYANRAIDRRLKVARVTWDGSSVTDVKDIRPISTVIQDPCKINAVKEAASSVINSLRARGRTVNTILIEDFNSPEYLDLNNVLWVTSNNGINYPIIPDYLPTSDDYLSCYRSRALRVIGSSEIYAYLVGADELTKSTGSVRLVSTEDSVSDIVMTHIGDGLFRADIDSSIEEIKVVVSGKASGVAVFNIEPED